MSPASSPPRTIAAPLFRPQPPAGPAALSTMAGWRIRRSSSRRSGSRSRSGCRPRSAFIAEHKLNEVLPGDLDDIGIIVMGGLTNGVLRALARLDLADLFGTTPHPDLRAQRRLSAGAGGAARVLRRQAAVLVVEEGYPDYIEQALNIELRRADIRPACSARAVAARRRISVATCCSTGSPPSSPRRGRRLDADAIAARAKRCSAHKAAAAAAVGTLPPRPPTFCTGCPERPVFTAIKLMQRELGPTHISADIGCHSFATFAPFSLGNSILGYGMSLASAAAVAPNMDRAADRDHGRRRLLAQRPHHRRRLEPVQQRRRRADRHAERLHLGDRPAIPAVEQGRPAGRRARHGHRAAPCASLGVKWLRKVRSYSVAKMAKTLKEAMRTAERGLKVIIADGECQLARQRRVRAEDAEKLKRGERVVRPRFGVDDEICTGDHSCIRLSGCPSLTVKPNPDPLRTRSGRDRDRKLRRLRPVRRGRACRRAVPVVLPRRDHPQSELVGSHAAPCAVPHSGVIRGAPAGASPAVAPTLQVRGDQAAVLEHGSRVGACAAGMTNSGRPITILIAALGGEGGGVLTDWIVGAAESLGLPVQCDVDPRRRPAHRRHDLLHRDRSGSPRATGGRRPVLALEPGVGDIDLMLASELMEAGRAIGGGLRHARPHADDRLDRPLLSDGRENGDGRRPLRHRAPDQGDRAHSRAHLLLDMDAIARKRGAMINAVMLGAHRGLRARCRFRSRRSRRAIRADGKAVDANLRGFRAGLAAAREAGAGGRGGAGAAAGGSPHAAWQISSARSRDCRPPAREVVGKACGGSSPIRTPPTRGSISTGWRRSAPPTRARVPAAASARDRAASRAAHVLRGRDPRGADQDRSGALCAHRRPRSASRRASRSSSTEFLKPGIEEFCSILPAALARPILALAERARLARPLPLGHGGQEHRRSSASCASGCSRSCAACARAAIASREEQRAIEAWLGLVVEAAARSPALALEVAECARPDQGLRRYPSGAAAAIIASSRRSRDRSGAGRRAAAARAPRRDRQRADGRAGRSRRRKSCPLPCGRSLETVRRSRLRSSCAGGSECLGNAIMHPGESG